MIFVRTWGYLCQTVSSISLQPRLATVGFTGTNGTDTSSNTQNNTVNDIHDLRNKSDYGPCHSQGMVGQRFSTQFSYIACLSLNFCPTLGYFINKGYTPY